MRKTIKSTLLGAVCLSTAFGALPPEALAGPMSATPPDSVGLSAPTTNVHYRRYRYGYYPRRAYYGYGGYYRPRNSYYGYDPAGALFASAALGIMGAGIAAATAPRWGYGGWGGPWGYGGYGGWGYGGGWGGPWGYGGWW